MVEIDLSMRYIGTIWKVITIEREKKARHNVKYIIPWNYRKRQRFEGSEKNGETGGGMGILYGASRCPVIEPKI